MKYDYVIAGAGLSSAVFARLMAEKGKKILVLERRSHIGGNIYDEKDENGIIVQKYGPHIFHTQIEAVNEFVTKYADWKPFKLQCEVFMCGKSTPSPFNFKTIDQFYDTDHAEKLKATLLAEYPGRETVTIVELLESKVEIIREYAQMLFDNDYSLYTAKQWGLKPSDIDVSVLKRVPVRMDYKSMYFTDKYEYMPVCGFTAFISNVFDHENIEVRTNEDALKYIELTEEKVVFKGLEVSDDCQFVYTGALDELFSYKYGELPYRSLRFDYKTLQVDSFQNAPVVAYPQEPGYTRVTEYKKLPVQNISGVTTIAYEYPLKYSAQSESDPYYPIPTEESAKQYASYKELADKVHNLILCGRLADYKYYNMDLAINAVLEKIK